AAARSQLHARVSARDLLRLVRPGLPALLGVGVVLSLGLVGVGGAGFALAFAAAFGLAAASAAGAGGVGILLFLAGIPVPAVIGTRLCLAGTVILMEGRHAPDIGLFTPERVGVGGALKRS